MYRNHGRTLFPQKKSKSALEEKTAKDSPFEEAEDNYKIDYGQSVDLSSGQSTDNDEDDDSKLTHIT